MTAATVIFDPFSSFNKGHISGFVKFFQEGLDYKTIIRIKLSGFKPFSVHGIHIHEWGDQSQGCDSACAHFNPEKTLHGSIKLYGHDRHHGDLLNNVHADKNGQVDIVYEDDLIDLSGKFSVIGRSVVIHEKEDDLGRYRYEKSSRGKESSTTGNAGKRIACSVIGLANPKNFDLF